LLALFRTRAFPEREAVLSSGKTSNFYIDCKRVSLDPEGATRIGELFRAQIDDVAPPAVAVGGLTLGAAPLAAATLVVSSLEAIDRARLAGLHVVHALGRGDRLEGGREAVTREAPLTTLFTRRDLLPDAPP
jgi:orotate phosphoribosyltransferase